jgi:hypothetical protein
MTRIRIVQTISSHGDSYYLQRGALRWCGRERGWQPIDLRNVPKHYTRRSGARAAAEILLRNERKARDAKRLHAAAPALLEACTLARDALANEPRREEVLRVVAQCEGAIRKATGVKA